MSIDLDVWADGARVRQILSLDLGVETTNRDRQEPLPEREDRALRDTRSAAAGHLRPGAFRRVHLRRR